MAKKSKKLNIFALLWQPISILLVAVVLLTVVSVAWVRREWAPYISSGENGMSISSTDALVFNMDVTDSNTDNHLSSSKTINALLDVAHFELKPVSNATGSANSFYKINYANSISEYTFVNVGNGNSNMEIGKENGYVDITFWVQGSNKSSTQFVYLHPDSHIGTPGDVKDSEKALRVAITAGSTTYLFSAEGARAKPYKAVTSTGYTYVKQGDEYVWNDSCITNLGVNAFKTFDEYNGYDENNVKNQEKCLFSVSATERVAIRIMIWLEGEDERCNEDIISEYVDLLIKFTAYATDSTQN